MSENLFKNHSISEIEEAISKAMSELVGRKVFVTVDALKVTGAIGGAAEFSVSAWHRSADPDGDLPF